MHPHTVHLALGALLTPRTMCGCRPPHPFPCRTCRTGETLCWYECTVQGGRKGSGLDVIQVSRAVEALGAGELLLNCIDNDGQNDGYDLGLTRSVRQAVGIPVIASSGAGVPRHFTEVFEACGVEAALAASILHRDLVSVGQIKTHLAACRIDVRPEGMPAGAGKGGRGWAAAAAVVLAVGVAVMMARR